MYFFLASFVYHIDDVRLPDFPDLFRSFSYRCGMSAVAMTVMMEPRRRRQRDAFWYHSMRYHGFDLPPGKQQRCGPQQSARCDSARVLLVMTITTATTTKKKMLVATRSVFFARNTSGQHQFRRIRHEQRPPPQCIAHSTLPKVTEERMGMSSNGRRRRWWNSSLCLTVFHDVGPVSSMI